MENLTDKQLEILKYVLEFQKVENCQPTMRDIAQHFAITPPSIQGQLRLIERKGFISLTGRARGIKFLKKF